MTALTIFDLASIDSMISDLKVRGYTGQEIAMALRDEGFAIQDVKVHLEEHGYHATFEAFLDLRSLYVSDYPLPEMVEAPVFDRNRAGELLVIWVGPVTRSGKFHA